MVVGVNPGMHVETHNSAVRVIQSDAIRRFASQWEQAQTELSPEEIYQIVSTIIRSATPDPDIDRANPRTAFFNCCNGIIASDIYVIYHFICLI